MLNRVLSLLTGFIYLSAYTATSQTYHYYFGNIHAHSAYSDGNKDTLPGFAKTPANDFDFAKQTYNFNFLGISEHNHSQAGMHLGDYKKGLAEAESINRNGQFVCMYGMEYGVISNGGHVVIYGIDSLVGWEPNNYNIYSPQYDYPSLWKIIADRPKAFATLAHPDNSDYNNLIDVPYSDTADLAIAGTAIRSGSAFSETTDYSDGPPSGVYNSYFRRLLAVGYKVAPTIDHDNHYTTFGRTSQSRTVVLAEALNRDSIMTAYKAMRFYASDDWNTRVNFTVDGYPLGSTVISGSSPVINVFVTDPDVTDTTASIKVYYGVPGSNILGTVLTSVTNSSQLSFVHNSSTGSSYYYYLEITQKDGDKIWTAPVWVNRSISILPLNTITLKGAQKKDIIELNAILTNADYESIVVEKSFKGYEYNSIATITKTGSESVTLTDNHPVAGYQYYRLRFIKKDGLISYSAVVSVLFIDNRFVIKRIYPNPAAHEINIAMNVGKETTVTINIYSSDGRLVIHNEQKLTVGENVIKQNVLSLPAGTCYVVATVENAKIETTFFKQ